MLEKKRIGGLARHAAIFSAFLGAAGKTLLSGLSHTPAERQITALPPGRMRFWANNVRLHLDEAIVLDIDQLVADIQVEDPELPLIPERVEQYTFHLLQGSIRLSAPVIETLLGRYLFSSLAVPLHDPSIQITESGMRLTANLNWGPLNLPVFLSGPVCLGDTGSIDLVAGQISAAGCGLKPLLHALRTDIEHVIRLSANGPLTACGNRLQLDPEQLLPNPRTRGRPNRLSIEPPAIKLWYEHAKALPAPPLLRRNPPAYIFCLGHNLLIGKMYLTEAVFQVVPRTLENKVLDFSLQQYRRQLAAGESTLSQRGELLVRLPNLDELKKL